MLNVIHVSIYIYVQSKSCNKTLDNNICCSTLVSSQSTCMISSLQECLYHSPQCHEYELYKASSIMWCIRALHWLMLTYPLLGIQCTPSLTPHQLITANVYWLVLVAMCTCYYCTMLLTYTSICLVLPPPPIPVIRYYYVMHVVLTKRQTCMKYEVGI